MATGLAKGCLKLSTENIQKDWYAAYYAKAGAGRNDLRANRGALLQIIATEISVVKAIAAMDLNPATSHVLDVGCGSGAGLFQFLRLGFGIGNICGIDVQLDRLSLARELYPKATFVHGDATKMDFLKASFDLVSESTMFATLTEDDVRGRIAAEMLRVTRPGGYLLLTDWRTPNPFSHSYKALTRRELKKLFKVGESTELAGVFPGALVPPLGRFLSAFLHPFYFPVAFLCPALVGQVVYLLRRK